VLACPADPLTACLRRLASAKSLPSRGSETLRRQLRLRVASPFVLDANERPRQESMLYGTA